MISNLFDSDGTDDLVLAMGVFGLVGLVLMYFLSRRAWRIQVAALLVLTGIWAGTLAQALTSNAYGSDCGEPHHGGEWPMLIVTLAWTVALLVALVAPNPPYDRIAARAALPLLTGAVIAGTFAVLLHVQPPC